jgi:predicted MFS family arabinose efflux permease
MTPEVPDERLVGWAALRRVAGEPRYRAYMLAATASMTGQWMQRIALGWILWEHTESGAWLGALAIASLAPGLVFGPLGGVLSDRNDRRRLVLVGESVLLVFSLLLCAVIAIGADHPVVLLALVGLAGAVSALQESARSILVRDVTPPNCLATGMSLNAVAVNVTRFLGPAIAGPLIAAVGPLPVFWINAAGSLIFVVVLLMLRDLGGAPATSKDKAGGVWSGFRIAGSHPVITPVLIGFAVSALLVRPFYELIPAFAEHALHGGVETFSQLVMAIGVGAMAGGTVLGFAAPRHPAHLFVLASLGACGAVSLLPFAASVTIALLPAVLMGFCMGINAMSSQLVVVAHAPDFASGRLLSVWGTIIRGGPALGALGLGVAFDAFGYRWPIWAGAAASAVVLVFVGLALRRNWVRADSLSPAE